MSIRTASASPTTSNAGLNTKSLQGADTWQRNPQWLALPTVLSTDQKMVGLHAIFPSANFIALVAAGDYTVDWGDGVTENFAANVVAYHEYDYANVAFDGTLTDLGYKQAIVTVTPQAGQNLTYLNLHQKHNQASLPAYSSGFLDIAVSSAELTDLRVCVSTPSLTTALINFSLLEQFSLINSNCKQLNNFFREARFLQNIGSFVTSSDAPVVAGVTFIDVGELVTLAGHGFRNGDSVRFTTITSTTGISLFTTYFVINATVDTFQLSTTYNGTTVNFSTDGSGTVVYGTNFRGMFTNCTALKTVPLFDTSNVTFMNEMFSGCEGLESVPLFNTVNVRFMESMFSSCRFLKSLPLFSTANVTDMAGMFISCSSLITVPLFNTSNVNNMQSMFNGCTSLKSVPLFNTSNVTSSVGLNGTFRSCRSLENVPLFDTSNCLSTRDMFNSCSSLKSAPAFDLSNANTLNMFVSCPSLSTVDSITTSGNTFNAGSMFNICPSLIKFDASNVITFISLASCKFSGSALNEVYTSLPIVTSQTISVTGNYGTATDDPTIATAKGWTVTG